MTPEIPSVEIRQNFEAEHEDTLAIFTRGDRKAFLDWLEQGEGGLKSMEAEFLVQGLDKHQEDFSQPIPKDLALIAAKFASLGQGLGAPGTRKEIRGLLRDSFGGEALKQVCAEGFEKHWTEKFVFKNPAKVETDLADHVSKVVDEFLAERKTAETVKTESTPVAEPVWGEEQKAAAEEGREGYEKLTGAQKKKLEAIVKKVLDSDGRLSAALLAMPLVPETLELLEIKLVKNISKKDAEFFQRLPAMVQYRIGELVGIKLEKEEQQRIEAKAAANKERIEGQLKNLRLKLDEDRYGLIDPQVTALIQEAADLGIDLPKEPLTADIGSKEIGQVVIDLNGAKSGLEIKAWQGNVERKLIALPDQQLDMPEGYSVRPIGKLDSGIYFEDKLVAKLQVNGDLVELQWGQGVPVGQALEATAVLGRGLSRDFPTLILELAESTTEEPTRTVPVGQETELPTEETSGSDLEVLEAPEPVQSEEDDFWKNFDAPPSAEPDAAPEPEPAKSPAVEQEEELVIPDWLKALREGEKPREAGPPPVEPEAPKPVAVTSARKPIEIVAQAIRERGGAEFEFDQTSAHNLFYGTLNNIIQGLYIPGLTINHFGISEFNISGGQIRLTVNAGGLFKKIISVPVSASMSFGLSSSLDLLGEPSINLPSLAPKEAKGLIINQLRQIKTELSRVIISGLSANKITYSSVENINIQNSSLLATIRGKVSR